MDAGKLVPPPPIVAFALLALALVMTTNGSPASRRVVVHGHRGARARFPENTIPAFQYAIRAGADVLELDMAVTKDNVIVVSHDPILEPPVCTGPRAGAVIHELTLAEVKQWDCGAVQNPRFPQQKTVPGTRMPTLDEVFALAPGNKVEFNIETKIFADKPQYTPGPREFAQLVLDVVRKHRLEKRVILQSFDFRTLRAMKELAPEIRLSALVEKDDREFTDIARDAGGAGIVSAQFGLVTASKTAAAHSAGLQVVPWTANEPADWQRLVDAGADAIISDDPEALIEWLRRRGLR
jgi:glycerophosphoryl diester phosphodiesterase